MIFAIESVYVLDAGFSELTFIAFNDTLLKRVICEILKIVHDEA